MLRACPQGRLEGHAGAKRVGPKDDGDDVRTNFGALLYDKVSSQGRFTPLDIVDAAISFIH